MGKGRVPDKDLFPAFSHKAEEAIPNEREYIWESKLVSAYTAFSTSI